MVPELYTIMLTRPQLVECCKAYLNLPAATLNLYNTLWTQMGVE